MSGQIIATGVQLSATAYSMAVLVDPATGESLGIDVRRVDSGLPAAFAIGYTITEIVPTGQYVVTAEVGDNASIWRSAAGVPVITNGNPKSGIDVTVVQVAVANASPSPSPSPSPSAAPTPPPAGGTSGDLLAWIIAIALIGGLAAFFVARSRAGADESTTEPPPDDRLPPDATPTDATPTDATETEPAPGAPDSAAPTAAPADGTTPDAPDAPTTPDAPAPPDDPGAAPSR